MWADLVKSGTGFRRRKIGLGLLGSDQDQEHNLFEIFSIINVSNLGKPQKKLFFSGPTGQGEGDKGLSGRVTKKITFCGFLYRPQLYKKISKLFLLF